MASRDKLNARQRLFVREYVWGVFANDARECLKLAGYKASDPSSQVLQLLRRPAVNAFYRSELAEKEELVKLRSLRWVDELERIALIDPSKLFDKDGELLPIAEMPEEARRAIAGFDVEAMYEGGGRDRIETGQVRKFKLHDKKGCLELLLKWAGKLKDKVDIALDKTTLEELVAASMQPDAKE